MELEETPLEENWCHQAVSKISFADAICAEKFCNRKNISTGKDPEIIKIEKRFENRRRYILWLFLARPRALSIDFGICARRPALKLEKRNP